MKIQLKLVFLMISLLTTSALAREDTPIHEIDFRYEVNQILVPLKVNGSEPLKAVFDTGMPNGVFIPHPKLGKKLNLKYLSQNVQIGGGGSETKAASLAADVDLQIGDIKLSGERAIVLNEADDISRFGFDAVIGASFFNNYVVEIDVPAQKLRFYDPKTYKATDAGEPLDLTISQTKPYITGKVKVNGKISSPMKIVIDTGAGLSLMVNESEKLGVTAPSKVIEGIFGAGVGGDITAKAGRLEALTFGKHSLTNVTAQFTKNPVPAGADALMGMRVLKRFKMTFDYQKKKLYLKQNKLINESFEFDLLGLVTRPTESGGIRVIEVFKGSAGEKAGIKKGDFVTGINGNPVTFKEWSVFKNGIRKPGKKVEMEIKRDGKKLSKSLVSTRLV